MFDHIGFNVDDVAKSKSFYVAALAPLGMKLMREGDGWAVIGGPSGRLWIGRLGLAAGGRDNGAPGLRPNYRPDYYAAFVFDPDGHNVEAVTFSAD